MNIIVLGNGFDLAHELPTEYRDFLAFCKMIKEVYAVRNAGDMDTVWERLEVKVKYNVIGLKELFSNLYTARVEEIDEDSTKKLKTNTVYDELYEDIKDNIWVDYFLANPMYRKENWIDFEGEIRKLIQQLDGDMLKDNGGKYELSDEMVKLTNPFLKGRYSKYELIAQSMAAFTEGTSESITFREIRDQLYDDLNKLNRALEIYLTEYVEKIECNLFSPDIKEAVYGIQSNKEGKQVAIQSNVLCFNYTNTYEKMYKKLFQREDYTVDYIHGKAYIENTIDTNSMVLGIDEYLGKERDEYTEFIAFKKFYQRIHKETGCMYKEWIERIREEYEDYMDKKLRGISEAKNMYPTLREYQIDKIKRQKCDMHQLYIFGHSLDITDGDVLRELILNDNVYTTIFYLNKDVMGQQIANLVKMIGQDELIKRTGGATKTIEFRQQKNMERIATISM